MNFDTSPDKAHLVYYYYYFFTARAFRQEDNLPLLDPSALGCR